MSDPAVAERTDSRPDPGATATLALPVEATDVHTWAVSDDVQAPLDPEELEATAGRASGEISPATTLGPVHLTVADLERSTTYYRSAIGLEVLAEGDGTASFGTGDRELLVVVEEPGARPAVGYSGLYHVALLLPERAGLARWLAHAARDRLPLTGLSDHYVSEAIYLSDPDGHGIEVYWDRPREVWEGQVSGRMTTLPLDTQDLLSELADPASEPFDGMPTGTVMGHVHLKVSSIPETLAFWRDSIGFALMAEYGSQAAFLAAGGYHHHLGANTWESAGVGKAPPGTAALRHGTIVLPDAAERDRVLARARTHRDTDAGPMIEDPSGNAFVLAVAA